MTLPRDDFGTVSTGVLFELTMDSKHANSRSDRCAIPLVRSVRRLLAVCLALCVSTPAMADKLTIGGTGSSGPMLNILFEEFSKQVPGHTLRTVSPPLGSGGATKAILAGGIDLAVVAREPAPDVRTKIGHWFHLADTPFVLVSNDASARPGLTLDELVKIYRGETAQWRSGKLIRLLLRASFDTDTMILKSMSPAMTAAVDYAANRPGMVTTTDDIETLDLLTHVPGSFGPITLGHLRTTGSTLQPLALDRIVPTPANLVEGRYPWRKCLYVLLPQKPSALAERFAAYLRSKAAEAVLNRYDYVRKVSP